MSAVWQTPPRVLLALPAGRRSPTLSTLGLLIGLCGACGLVLAIYRQIVHGTTTHALAIGLLGLLITGFVGRTFGAAGACSGRLEIDADGAATWTAESSPDRLEGLHPPAGPRHDTPTFRPIAWFCLVGIAWIDGQCEGHVVRLILTRDRLPADDWIRLRRWLRWLDRGGHAKSLSSVEVPTSHPMSMESPRERVSPGPPPGG